KVTALVIMPPAGAALDCFSISISHNRAAAQIREDVKKMVQLPLLRQGRPGARDRRLFGVPLLELKALGLAADGVPWVVGIMVEFLREHALQQEGLFRVNGNVRVAEALRQRFESGEDVNLLQEGDVCVVASLLKQFLRELPEGVVTSDLQAALLQLYQECGEEQCGQALRDLLHGLPDVHYDLLRYLCRFLTQVAEQHQHNRMTALNLATVFGPNVFHVSPGFDGMREQNICNKIMAKLIQGYGDIFENDGGRGDAKEEHRQIITVKVKKVRRDDTPRDVPQPPQSDGLPHQRPLPTPRTRSVPGDMDLSSDDLMSPRSSETLNSRLVVLERTVKSAVEQHLFGGRVCGGQSSEDSEQVARAPPAPPTPTVHPPPPTPTPCAIVWRACVCEIPLKPVPAYSSWQRESMDREEARLSPHTGGRPIRQLLQEDSDPMLSPRFHSYGHCPQYLEDTEVPPSPPNTHPFMSRRRSSSLGSCEDDREELTSAQLSKKIHALKRKIRKYEEKFEEEHKYRPSHSDKAENPEVFRWMNELSKLRKELKEHQLMKSEEDLPPLTRQRSNTLPKSFGSQLDRRPQEKAPKPPVENTLEGVQKKLQEKREEAGRPEDIKDMTREQIVAEKVALQKALLYYESIHGRPVTNSERQIMKPLYDRYRLVKQILCRASAIPVIGSPSSKRRGPLLQPIIEGVPALFFDNVKEEEDGSEDDGDAKTPLGIPIKSDFSMLGLLDHLDEDVDGFVSPVDELSPTKNSTDMRLSNLHSATMEELLEQLQEAREEKKRLRKNLREFEDQFFRQNGRNVQKEDRSPLAEEYSEYKHVKAKLRLLEVLISKRDSSKFI
uniref:Family with sequence similarity 13 member A n=1 Tax=Scleropages formosus TaxID=113540 RepID=A0A8C9T634_SCLFO